MLRALVFFPFFGSPLKKKAFTLRKVPFLNAFGANA